MVFFQPKINARWTTKPVFLFLNTLTGSKIGKPSIKSKCVYLKVRRLVHFPNKLTHENTMLRMVNKITRDVWVEILLKLPLVSFVSEGCDNNFILLKIVLMNENRVRKTCDSTNKKAWRARLTQVSEYALQLILRYLNFCDRFFLKKVFKPRLAFDWVQMDWNLNYDKWV